MAELLGVIASGISVGTLAAQIGSNLKKLKSYWDEMRDVPESLISLLEDIEILNSILKSMEDDRAQNPISSTLLDRTSASVCLAQCKKAAERLQELVDELSIDMYSTSGMRRKWAANKAIFKKEKLERYKSKLEGTMRLLMLSQQYYQSSLIQQQPEIIIAQISQLPAIAAHTKTRTLSEQIEQLDSNAGNDVVPYDNRKSRSKFQQDWSTRSVFTTTSSLLGGFYFQQKANYSCSNSHLEAQQERKSGNQHEIFALLRMPSWIINKAWQLQAAKAYSGWNIALSTYNIIPNESVCFDFIRKDNVLGLRNLFEERLASPFDRDENGNTLLARSSNSGSLAVCNLLLDLGADPTIKGNTLGNSIWCLTVNGSIEPTVRQSGLLLQTARRLLPSDPESTLQDLDLFRGTNELLEVFQQNCYPDYYKSNLIDRINRGIGMTRHPDCVEPKTFRTIISQGPIDKETWRLRGKNETSLFCALAAAIGTVRAVIRWERQFRWGLSLNELQLALPEWRELFRQGIIHNSDIHAVNSQRKTPFLSYLGGIYQQLYWTHEYQWKARHASEFINFVREYAGDLQKEGVDLQEYGRQEKELLDRGVSSKNIEFFRYPYGERIRLISFTYGPDPADWYVWVAENNSVTWAREFWHMVEEPWNHMPGAWIVEHESDSDEHITEDDKDESEDESESDE